MSDTIKYTYPDGAMPEYIRRGLQKPVIKLAIVTGMWQRQDVFRLFGEGINQLRQIHELDIYLIVAGSEGVVSKALAQEYQAFYIEIPNQPLAEKMNATTLLAKRLNVDYVLCVGSDDIIAPELMHRYIHYMRRGFDFIGITDMYFWDTVSQQAAYWGGYREPNRKGNTAGAGRMLSTRIMHLLGWQPWENRHSKVLDNSMEEKLKQIPHTSATFSIKEHGLYALDIKSETNMTPFKLWDNTEFISPDILKQQFPYVWHSSNH